MAILLHKTALVNFPMATTVCEMCFSANVFSILNVPFVEWASHYDMAQHNYSPSFETSLDVSDLCFNC